MQPKRTRSSKPKLFQCQGYGDCNMVFTRSEHLARHARKHTGEKPFICVVPECNKAFSRFDNMMQHTQTHRNSGNNNMMSHKRDTRSTTKAKCQQQQQKRYTIVSPISLSPSTNTICSSSSISSSSSEEDEEEEQHYPYHHHHHKRRLSIADLCNPLITEDQSKLYQLTKDEFEALEGFGRFRHTPPSVFFKDLASTHVEN